MPVGAGRWKQSASCLVGLICIGVAASGAFAQSNIIASENANPGSSGWQLTNPAENHEIEGYASLNSVNHGGQIKLFVSTSDPSYSMRIFRMGWYGGAGARLMMGPISLPGVQQPMPAPDPATGIVECNWSNPYVLAIPGNWVSGVYLAVLTSSSGKQGYIQFVVRNDGYPAAMLLQLSVTTDEAYNRWGGKSLYAFNSSGGTPAVKVSFNRPYDWHGDGTDYPGWNTPLPFFAYEYPMVRYLERNSYDVSYSTDVDTHTSPDQLVLHNGLLFVGHDEYWSWEMRENVANARDQGVGLGFFSADDSGWQIRFEPSALTADANRTIVGYKENVQNDPDAANPASNYLMTTEWRFQHGIWPGLPEDALAGVMQNGAEPASGDIVIGDTSNWVFNGAGLRSGDHLAGLLGYEVDQEYGHAPSDIVRLAHSPYTFVDGTTHYSDMTVYQAASGATVFAAGTMRWAWGLDSFSPSPVAVVSSAARQITANVLASFMAQGPGGNQTPALTLSGPANGATVSGQVSMATRTNSSVVWTNLYVDGAYAQSPGAAFDWDSTTVGDGNHALMVVGFDTNGQPVGSSSLTVMVANSGVVSQPSGAQGGASQPVAPAIASAVAITAPANGATLSGAAAGIIAQVSSDVMWINIYIDGDYLTSSPPYTFSWDTTAVPNGPHTISANAYDHSNALIGTSSVAVNVSN